MNEPLISIIVPVYKVETYLERCVTSILNQTYSNFELILIDDGSPDNCPKICDQFAEKDTRIKVIHKANGGLSDARNAGLDLAKGEYIGFVDSDDFISQNMYEKLMTSILETNADMAVCNFVYVDDKGSFIEDKNISMPVKDEELDIEAYTKRMTGEKGWYYVTAWNKLYNKALFNEMRFPKDKQHEDEFLIHHLIYQCKCIVCIKEALYYYVQRSGSIMSQNNYIKMLDYGEALIDRYYLAKKKKNKLLRINTIQKLTNKLEEWESYAQLNKIYKKKYTKLRLKSLFLLFEKTAWSDYNSKGKVYMKLHLIAPGISNWILKSLKQN